MPALVYGSIDLTQYPYQLFPGADMGSAAAITAVVERLLTDGEVVSGRRRSNRTVTIPLGIIASDRTTLAAAEAALALEADKESNSLTIIYGDGTGQPMVADTFIADLVPQYSDVEDNADIRSYELTIPALPFLRNPNLTTLTPSAAAPVQLDSMDSLSGRTISGHGSGGAGVTSAVDTSTYVEGTGSIKLSSSVTYTAPAQFTISRTISAVDLSSSQLVTLSVLPSLRDGYFTAPVWKLTLTSASGSKTWTGTKTPWSGTFDTVTWDLTSTPYSSTGSFSLAAVTGYTVDWTFQADFSAAFSMNYDNLAAQSSIGGPLTSAQGVVRYRGVQGAARTPTSFVINPTTTQNARRLFIATSPGAPEGYNPLLPITSGMGTADANALSGYRGSGSWTLPAHAYSGSYVVWARVKPTSLTGATVSVTAHLTGDTAFTDSAIRTAFDAGELSTSFYTIIPVGVITLPPREVDTRNTSQTITVTAGGTNMQFDSLYLADMDGQCMFVDLWATGVSYQYWWVDAPAPGDAYGKVFAGTVPDRSDAVNLAPWVRVSTVVNLSPGDQSMLFVLDQVGAGATITASYYSRWLAERPS